MSSSIIRQRSSRDCGVCAAAMATGKRYEDIIKLSQFAQKIGMATAEISNAMTVCRVPHMHITTAEGMSELDGTHGGARFGITQKFARELIGNKRAVLVVRNEAMTGFHAVYLKNGWVHDPGTGEKRMLRSEDEILEALIIHEPS